MAHSPTDRPFFRSWRFPLLLAAGALLLSGCGLSDYTGQMVSEEERVRAWDEEAKLVGNPITMPQLPKKDDKAQVWYVFLRLPLGMSEAPVTQPKSSVAQLYGPLAQYPSSDKRFGIQNAYLGVAVDQQDFPGMVCNQFGVTPSGDTLVTIPHSPTLFNPDVTARAGANADVVLKRRTGEGQASYEFYFYEHGKVQVAVVFQMEKGSNQRAAAAIKASLATLAEGNDADSNDAMYKKWNTRPQKKWF